MKRKKRKAMAPLAQELRAAYDRGKEKGLWTNFEVCAQKMSMNTSTLAMQCNGHVKDKEILDETLRKIKEYLKEQDIDLPEPREHEPSSAQLQSVATLKQQVEELQELYKRGKQQGLWSCISDCARRMPDISRVTLSRYLRVRIGDLDRQARKKEKLEQTLQQLRTFLSTEHPAGRERSPPEGMCSPKEWPAAKQAGLLLLGVWQRLAQNVAQQTLRQTLEALEGCLPAVMSQSVKSLVNTAQDAETHAAEQDLERVLECFMHSLQGPEQQEPVVISGTLYDRVLAGVADLRDSNLQGVRFPLNARTFPKYQFQGIVTQQEVRDTEILMEEVARRFKMFRKLENLEQRSLIAQHLKCAVERLYEAIEQSADVCPTEAARKIEADRKVSSLLED